MDFGESIKRTIGQNNSYAMAAVCGYKFLERTLQKINGASPMERIGASPLQTMNGASPIGYLMGGQAPGWKRWGEPQRWKGLEQAIGK